MRGTAKLLWIVALSLGTASPALAQRFPFERSFDVSGPSTLDVSTIRGKIEVTPGEPGRIVVVGTATVRVGNVPADAVELARKVAGNPPVQRDGQTIKLRPPTDAAEQRAVTVSYQVRVPPETEVTTSSDSGATSVRGVSRSVVIRTQSGAIDADATGRQRRDHQRLRIGRRRRCREFPHGDDEQQQCDRAFSRRESPHPHFKRRR